MFPAPPAVVVVHARVATGDPMADPDDPPELLRVQVQQIAGPRVFVPLADRRRLALPPPRQPGLAEDAGRGGGTDADGGRDLAAGPLLLAQHLDAERDRRPRLAWMGAGATRPIDQPGHAVSPKAGPPLPRGADGDAELLSDNAGHFTRVQAVDEFSSTKRRQSRILVDVHPGLLSRESDCLAAINFPQVGLGEQPSDSSQLVRPGEREVIGRPYTTAGGKTVHVRVESAKHPSVACER